RAPCVAHSHPLPRVPITPFFFHAPAPTRTSTLSLHDALPILPWLSVALKAARLPGDSLIFQIEEDHAIMLLKQAKEFTKGLTELHCRTSLSHFGCAISPFNTLKHVDVNYVKLDGSFTDELQKGEEAREKVKEMIQSLQSAGKLAIVPDVESATVLSTLWQAGVNYVQGD